MARPKALELPGVEGEGVSLPTDKRLEKLGNDFIECRDAKAAQAETLTKIEAKILDRMNELKITSYRFHDQVMEIKEGRVHIKIKTVKVGVETDGEGAAE